MKILITFCFSILLLSCSSIRKKDKTVEDNTFIASILPVNTYQIFNQILEIDFYKLEEKRIKGTKDEYTNKAVFIRNLNAKEIDLFISMISIDASYMWNSYSEKEYNFSPTKEFRLKGSNGKVNILVDQNKELISFINLDGQNIIPISTKLKTYLEKFN